MSRKKREARDSRKEANGLKARAKAKLEQMSKRKSEVEIPFTDFGSASFKNGFFLPIMTSWKTFKNPFKLVVFSLLCMLTFFLLRSFVLMAFNQFAFPEGSEVLVLTQQKISMAVWEIATWLLGPMMLYPWLVGNTIFNAGYTVPKESILEAFQRDKHLRHVLGLGLIFVIVMGGFGAILSMLSPKSPIEFYTMVACSAIGWFVVKLTMMASTANLWKEDVPFWRAFWMGLKGWRYFWKPVLGALLGVFVTCLVILAALSLVMGLPLYFMFKQAALTGNPFIGVLLMPLFFVLLMVYYNFMGAFSLALAQWGTPKDNIGTIPVVK